MKVLAMSFSEVMIIGKKITLPNTIIIFLGEMLYYNQPFFVVSFPIIVTGRSSEYLEVPVKVVKSEGRKVDLHCRQYKPLEVFDGPSCVSDFIMKGRPRCF